MATNPPAVIPSALVHVIMSRKKCSETTFQSWKDSMEMFFLGCQASYMISNPIAQASVPTDKQSLDSQLPFYIYNTLEEDLQYLVAGKVSGLEQWKAVVGYFQKSNLGSRLEARKAFNNVEHDPSKPLSIYVHDVVKAAQVLKDLSVTVDDSEVRDLLLNNLHKSYLSVKTSILTASDEPDLKKVKSILTGSSLSVLQIKQEEGFTHAANATRSFKHPRTPSAHSSSSPHAPYDHQGNQWCNPGKEGYCFRCGKEGHFSHKCIFDMPKHIKDWVVQGGSSSSHFHSQAAQAQEEPSFDGQQFAGVSIDDLDVSNILGPLHI